MLSIPDRTRLLRLVGLHNAGRMTPAHEAEMRSIIATEYPAEAKTYDLDLAIRLGLGMAAVHFFFPEDAGLQASN